MTNIVKKDPVIYALIVAAFLSNVAAIVFGVLNTFNIGGLFNNSIGNLSAKYFTEVTPNAYIFIIIWPILYLWTFAGSVYLVVGMFLPPDKSPVNFVPTLTPKSFLIPSCIGPLTCVVWLFTFDWEMMWISFIVQCFGTLALWGTVRTSLLVVHDNLPQLEAKSKAMLWVVRVVIHNGLSLFATWGTVATTIGFSICLIYQDSVGVYPAQPSGIVSQQDGSTYGLMVLGGFIAIIFVVENFTCDKYFTYVFSIFPVLIMTLAGLVARLTEIGASSNLVIACIELAVCVLALAIRITLSVFRLKPKQSDYPTKKSLAKIDLLSDYN